MKNIYRIKVLKEDSVVEAVIIVSANELRSFVESIFLKSYTGITFNGPDLKPLVFENVHCDLIGPTTMDVSNQVIMSRQIKS